MIGVGTAPSVRSAGNAVRPARAAAVAVWSLFAIVLVRTAWVSDDAYLTFRTIDNFVHGYGLRWNIAERVQVYTHPLWLMVMTAAYAITREAYFTSIAVSIAITLAAVRVLLRRADLTVAAPWIAALLVSRAFVDYSTSGLENPLTHLLLVLFLTTLLSASQNVTRVGVIACLLALNRLDTLLMVLPSLWAVTWAIPRNRRYREVAIAFIPLVAWELFSIIYYGFPFPNTAYAKLKTAIPEHELLYQGLLYLLDSVRRDPITLPVIGLAIATMITRPWRSGRAVAVGMLLYLAYIVWVGGDFMSGRFLSALVLAAVVNLSSTDVFGSAAASWLATAVIVLIGLSAPHSTLADLREVPDAGAASGIADERLFYVATNGLVNVSRDVAWPSNPAAESGRRARREGKQVTTYCCNGMLGYFGGPDLQIVDIMGLGDPLLARLPAIRPWRIGHYQREIPDGYVGSIESGTNQLRDPRLAEYYDRLRVITRGPIWRSGRLKTILKMNSGAFDDLLKP
jgi:arabinofuranosyltransferase